ncbi:hypothetical protein OSB04_019698 [Centaurea solstitialis]|uniref:Uncharacterized protein n=1 Tax=Centaurea solstitialis TaxID=347529 RepID=A0AA38SQT8_9ASTR|nr:hypothetical protein OSB04_019698 [Centaurea solstitialis]
MKKVGSRQTCTKSSQMCLPWLLSPTKKVINVTFFDHQLYYLSTSQRGTNIDQVLPVPISVFLVPIPYVPSTNKTFYPNVDPPPLQTYHRRPCPSLHTKTSNADKTDPPTETTDSSPSPVNPADDDLPTA